MVTDEGIGGNLEREGSDPGSRHQQPRLSFRSPGSRRLRFVCKRSRAVPKGSGIMQSRKWTFVWRHVHENARIPEL